jgi:uncharacterized protein (TIGR00255 family)
MTAFGRAKHEGKEKDITVEIRSVNSRYFDFSVRLPREYTFMEDRIRAYVQKNAAARGKVEVSVTVARHTAAAATVRPDLSLAAGYLAAYRELAEAFSLANDVTVARLAENRDILLHCHIASSDRKIPGTTEYEGGFLDTLKKIGYDGIVTVECGFGDFREEAKIAAEWLRAKLA